MPIIILIATVLVPPLGVALKQGFGSEFLISLLLTIFFFLPGMIYSLYVNFVRA